MTAPCRCEESIALAKRLELTSSAYAECSRRFSAYVVTTQDELHAAKSVSGRLADDLEGARTEIGVLQDRLFECDEDDSAALHEMRAIIDDYKLWDNEAQEEAGDYQGKMVQLAVELRYFRGMHSPSELRQMRLEIANGWLPEGSQSDFDEVLP